MVALHNKRLSDRDLFPGVLWTDKQWHELREQYRAQLIAEGVQEPHLQFRLSKMMEEYQRTQPSMRERQQIRKKIWPPQPARRGPFTDEELDWLIDRLDRVNDPIGLDVLEKLRTMKT